MDTEQHATVVDLQDLDATQVALAGGKAAHLGTLMRLDGVVVPAGFCVTTHAYRRVATGVPSLDALLGELAAVATEDRDGLRTCATEVRRAIAGVAIPDDVAAAITDALARLGAEARCAVRSSATAEDLPTASFAGQHDSFLDVVGPEAILAHVRRCWASLYTERAVAYRRRTGIDDRSVQMAVVVQRMVPARASGVLFTADPVTGNRRVSSVEATSCLGEALVSGHASGDGWTVRDGEIRTRTTGSADGRRAAALSDAQVVRLAALGRRIEAHLGYPQDIEWCLADDELVIVQSRPITTLFPLPAGADDGAPHVYVSVGHQQMMTDPMKPLGISLFQLTALPPMHEAGGRLFVDAAPALSTQAGRDRLLQTFERSDPLLADALRTLLERGDVVPPPTAAGPAAEPPATAEPDPAVVPALVAEREASLAALERDLRSRSGTDVVDAVLADIPQLKRLVFDPRSTQVVMAGMEAAWWLGDHLEAWLGERRAADTLARSVPHNVTSEMGLALLDVADAVRPHPEAVAVLERADGGDVLAELPGVPGGREARDAIAAFLDTYGMRCAGEIDVTRPRWREDPSAIVPMLLAHVRNAEPGAAARHLEDGRRAAEATARDVLERVRALPDGARKAAETERAIGRLRAFSGFREYPKFTIVGRFLAYKQALLREAGRLVAAGVLRDREDLFFLTLPEVRDVVRTHEADHERIARRRAAHEEHHALTPPRVITAEGEALTGAHRRDEVPDGALAGLPVSDGGAVEGRARVVLDLAQADLGPGDILVTRFTDPSWSPAFLAVDALVTEVGGLMTHGAVIAREYGLPAVVGVEHATSAIRDGQRIRVHGTGGYVELL